MVKPNIFYKLGLGLLVERAQTSYSKTTINQYRYIIGLIRRWQSRYR